MSWLKTGKQAKELVERNKLEKELRDASRGKAYRFRLAAGETARITFIDGNLDDDGEVDCPRCVEHFDMKNMENYVCPEKTDPAAKQRCPTCARNGKGDWPSLVSFFSIIDHRTRKSKDGTKTFTNERRMYTPKPEVMEKLERKAKSQKGLAGTTWDVTRGKNEKSAATGDDFDFIEKTDVAILTKRYLEDRKDVKGNVIGKQSAFYPFDYEKEIVSLTEEEMLLRGYGSIGEVAGSSSESSGGYIPSSAKDMGNADIPPEDADELEHHL